MNQAVIRISDGVGLTFQPGLEKYLQVLVDAFGMLADPTRA